MGREALHLTAQNTSSVSGAWRVGPTREVHAGPPGNQVWVGTEIWALDAMLAVNQSHQAERVSAGFTAPPPGRAGAGHVTKARVPPAHTDAESRHPGPRPNWQRTGQVLWHRESGRLRAAHPVLQQSPVQDNLGQRWGVLGRSLLLLLPQLTHLWNGMGTDVFLRLLGGLNKLIQQKYSACHKHVP